MCVKLSPGDLNPGPFPLYPTSIYTYKMTTIPRVCGNQNIDSLTHLLWIRLISFPSINHLITNKSQD